MLCPIKVNVHWCTGLNLGVLLCAWILQVLNLSFFAIGPLDSWIPLILLNSWFILMWGLRSHLTISVQRDLNVGLLAESLLILLFPRSFNQLALFDHGGILGVVTTLIGLNATRVARHSFLGLPIRQTIHINHVNFPGPYTRHNFTPDNQAAAKVLVLTGIATQLVALTTSWGVAAILFSGLITLSIRIIHIEWQR